MIRLHALRLEAQDVHFDRVTQPEERLGFSFAPGLILVEQHGEVSARATLVAMSSACLSDSMLPMTETTLR